LRGVVLCAERQLLGKGRSGNVWSSERGGLYVTAVLPATADAVTLPRTGWLPLAAAIACVEMLQATFGIAAQIKWPNDVLVGGHKLAGLLGEVLRPSEGPAAGHPVMLVSMGLNWLNPIAADVKPRFPVTSVVEHFPELTEAGRFDFLCGWLEGLAARHVRLAEGGEAGTKELRRAGEGLLWRLGERIRLERTEQGIVEGKLLGLNEMGGALVRLEDGQVINVHCGWQSGR
jgi:BirA family biotin operon repressor/biotin-[acetyl-CoA-carboxylase] ligase